MFQLTTVVIACTFLFTTSYLVASSSVLVAPENQRHAGLIFLGAVDGKSFYVDNTAAANWSDAKLNCQKGYMYLASIATPAQEDLLKSAYGSNFSGTYWTAGRDALTLQQLVWDHNLRPVPTNSSVPLVVFPKIISCLQFYSNRDNSTYRIRSCDDSGYPALCEIYDACSNFTFY